MAPDGVTFRVKLFSLACLDESKRKKKGKKRKERKKRKKEGKRQKKNRGGERKEKRKPGRREEKLETNNVGELKGKMVRGKINKLQ